MSGRDYNEGVDSYGSTGRQHVDSMIDLKTRTEGIDDSYGSSGMGSTNNQTTGSSGYGGDSMSSKDYGSSNTDNYARTAGDGSYGAGNTSSSASLGNTNDNNNTSFSSDYSSSNLNSSRSDAPYGNSGLDNETSESRHGTSSNIDSYAGSAGDGSYGPGTTSGIDLGNKSSSTSADYIGSSNLDSTMSGDRFGAASGNTASYTGAGNSSYGASGVTSGGVGYGNSTNNSSSIGSKNISHAHAEDVEESKKDSNDSAFGKILQKAGAALHNEKIEQKGIEKREAAGATAATGSSVGGGVDSYGESEATSTGVAGRDAGVN